MLAGDFFSLPLTLSSRPRLRIGVGVPATGNTCLAIREVTGVSCILTALTGVGPRLSSSASESGISSGTSEGPLTVDFSCRGCLSRHRRPADGVVEPRLPLDVPLGDCEGLNDM
jgi:hypothetical protein